MNFTIRPMLQAEHKYSYTESSQLMARIGCIGHLRGDMGNDGLGFYTSWDDHQPDLKTEDFKAELDAVINALRFDASYGGILADRDKLATYCWSHPESRMDEDGRNFGFRADTDNYAYMLRLNPNRGEYSLYVYCYVRALLDGHMARAGQDAPIHPDLPEKCFAALETTGEIIIVHRGVMGYTPTGQCPECIGGQEGADALNAQLGVTKAQAAAMLTGSMFGWACPGADPANYDEQGRPVKRSEGTQWTS